MNPKPLLTLPSPAEAPAAPLARRSRADWWLLALVLIGGVAASIFAYQSATKVLELRSQQILRSQAQTIADGLGAEMQRAVESVRATGFLMAKPGDPKRQEFLHFGKAVMANVPSMSFLEWQPYVPGPERAQFEAMARAQGLTNFRLTEPAGTALVPVQARAHYVPVLFGLPEGAAALGVDMAFDPRRMASKWMARDTGLPQASETFPLISPDQTLSASLGFAISVAVFHEHSPPAPMANTAQASTPAADTPVKGFVAGVFQLAGLMREAHLRATQAHIDLQVLDHSAHPAQLIYGSDKPSRAIDGQEQGALSLPVQVAGRQWTLQLRQQPGFAATQLGSDPRWVLLGGLLATGLLTTALYRVQRSRRLIAQSQAHTQAAERRVEHERQRLDNILEGTQAGTWEWHIPTGEVRLNERWASMLGYSLLDLTPVNITTWQHLCHPDDLLRANELLQTHFTEKTSGYEAEVRMRHRDGRWVWILARGCVISRDARGNPAWMAGTHLDISESKRLNQNLVDLHTALDAHAIVAITDAHGVITFVNDRFCSISGYRREELIGQTHRIVNSGYHPPVFFAALWATLLAGKTWRGHIQNRTKAGKTYWLDTAITPMLDNAGRPAQFIAIRYEITAAKQYETDLLLARNQLEQAAKIADLGIWRWTPDTDFQVWNERMFQMYEMPEDLRGTGAYSAFWHSRVHPDDIGEVERLLVAAVKGPGVYAPTFRIVTPSGGVRHIQATAIVERNEQGRAVEVMGINRDITEQRQLEDALRKSETRWRRILNEMPVGMCLVNTEWRIFFRNRRFTEMFGYSEDELPDLAAWWRLAFPDPEYTRWVKTTWDAAMQIVAQGGEVIPPMTYSIVCKSGEVRQVEIASRATEFGFLSTFVDLTQHEQQQRQLQTARAQAEEASRAKSAFLANMSHEIRTPMSGTLGMLGLLLRTQLSPQQHDYATKAQTSTQALLGIINDILDFSKVESGKMELEAHPFSLSALTQSLAAMLCAHQGDKDVDLLFDIDPAIPDHVLGDELRLRQVLLNLCGNALKFTEHGEVVLAIAQVGRDERGVALEFSVRDSGIGIAPEAMQRIFEGFSQAESSTSRRFGGTGLGLAISSRLIALMGARLQVQSILGQGSRFFFTLELPVYATPQRLAHVPTPHGGEQPSTPYRVLLVDDNATARSVLSRLCAHQGWHCDSVASADAALAALRRAAGSPYDVALIDWRMPDRHGLDIARLLQAQDQPPAPPVILMASEQDRAAIERHQTPGVDRLCGHLVKPVTPEALRQAVAHALAPELATRLGASQATTPIWQPSQRLQGMRVLVVEDNAFNQQIAQELLSGDGALVAIASDGLSGVAMALAEDAAFDVVLMDLQMPGIDGFEAARRIRQSGRCAQLPIIAMTANAMQSDRLACLQAGMNDHIGKPVELAELIRVLRLHTGRPALAPSDPAQSAPAQSSSETDDLWATPAEPGTQPVTTGVLASDSALQRLGNDKAFYRKLLRNFCAESVHLLNDYQQALDANARHDAVRHLHTLKGIAATIGALDLSQQLAQAEADLQQTPSEAPPPRPALRPILDATLEHIATLQPPAPQTPEPLPGAVTEAPALAQQLDTLIGLLSQNDMAAIDACEQLLAQFGATGATGATAAPALTELAQAMDTLDFARACQACKDLRNTPPAQ